MVDWSVYEGFSFEQFDDGVLKITIEGTNRANSLNKRQLVDIARIWREVDDCDDVRVVVITGQGDFFCAGGDLRDVRTNAPGNYEEVMILMEDARNLVLNIVNCDKPIVSAINGPAVGAGLAIALLADISIIGETVKISDGHVTHGIAAGDHAVILWPLLCSMAQAKYYLLTGDSIIGTRAAEIGLVSLCTPNERVLDDALEVAHKLALGSKMSLRWTKRALNHWMRAAQPTFESSLALEMIGFFGHDAVEGLDSFIEKREAKYD